MIDRGGGYGIWKGYRRPVRVTYRLFLVLFAKYDAYYRIRLHQ